MSTSTRSRTTKFLALVAITALAAFLRLYRIDGLPPSAGYDQAAYGIDALQIHEGYRPIFLPTHLGREAMYSYLVALCALFVRDTGVAVYVTSALVGVLTVPAVFLAADEAFAGQGGALAQLGGLLAALVLAVSHWHLSWSRLGMRVVLVPLFCSLTMWLLWRGLRTGHWLAFGGAGLFLGLGMYTYQAFRIFPLVVLFSVVVTWWSRRARTRRDLLHLLVLGAVALAVFAPLGIYFGRHPGSSTQAIGEAIVVGPSRSLAANLRTLGQHVLKVLLAYGVRGDQDPRVTIAGRSALNPFLFVALLAGLGVAVLRWQKPLYPTLLVWVAVMSVPAVFATGGATTKRALGAIPAVAMLIAAGCLVPWERVRRLACARGTAWARGLWVLLSVLLVGGLVYSGVRTYRDYMVTWSADPNLFTHFEVGIGAIGRLVGQRPAEERIYLSPVPADHPSLALYASQRQGIKTYHGRHCLVVPERVTVGATYVVVTAEDEVSLDALAEALPGGEVVATGPLHYGQPYYTAYHVPAGTRARVQPAYARQANWDGKIQLLGYDLERRVYRPGETAPVTLYQLGTAPMEVGYTAFVQLLGPHNPATGGPLWAQDDSEPCRGIYPTTAWEKGEIVVDRFSLTVPQDAPPGQYAMAVGYYDWRTSVRLPVLDEAGDAVGDHVILGEIEVRARE